MQGLVHGRIVDTERTATSALAPLQSDVCRANQFRQVTPVFGTKGNPNAAGDRQGQSRNFHFPIDVTAQVLNLGQHLFRGLSVGQEKQELVASDPAQKIRPTAGFFQEGHRRIDQLVTYGVPMGVIYCLQKIQIDVENRRAAVLARLALKNRPGVLIKQVAPGEAGQRITARCHDRFLFPLPELDGRPVVLSERVEGQEQDNEQGTCQKRSPGQDHAGRVGNRLPDKIGQNGARLVTDRKPDHVIGNMIFSKYVSQGQSREQILKVRFIKHMDRNEDVGLLEFHRNTARVGNNGIGGCQPYPPREVDDGNTRDIRLTALEDHFAVSALAQ